MFTLTFKGLSEDLKQAGAEFDVWSSSVETKEAVMDHLRQIAEAELDDFVFEPSVMITGEDYHFEVRREGRDLFLYDKKNLNIQGLGISPETVFNQSGLETLADDESEEPAPSLAASKDRKGFVVLLAIGLVATVLLQSAIYMANDPDPFKEVPIRVVSNPDEIETLRSQVVGNYMETSGDVGFGVELKADGTYSLWEMELGGDSAGKTEVFETASYSFGTVSGGGKVILLQDSTLVEMGPDGLGFYGYTLVKRVNTEGDS